MVARRSSRGTRGMKMSKCHMWMAGAAVALLLFVWLGAGGAGRLGGSGRIGQYLEGFKEGKEGKEEKKGKKDAKASAADILEKLDITPDKLKDVISPDQMKSVMSALSKAKKD